MFPRFTPAILVSRTPQEFKVAHIRVGEDLWCLDLDLHAKTPEELRQRIAEKMTTLMQGSVLPAAELEAWRSISGGTLDHTERMRCKGARFNVLQLVYVRPHT